MYANSRLANVLKIKTQSFVNLRWISYTSSKNNDYGEQIVIPPYQRRKDENTEHLKARLVYQSRKRGMLENGLLLSTFAAKFLSNMNTNQLQLYDRLINEPSNDWDLYYWATGLKPTPKEHEHEVMQMLKEHVKNSDRKLRIRQPDLY